MVGFLGRDGHDKGRDGPHAQWQGGPRIALEVVNRAGRATRHLPTRFKSNDPHRQGRHAERFYSCRLPKQTARQPAPA
jgi:hypothetical protein